MPVQRKSRSPRRAQDGGPLRKNIEPQPGGSPQILPDPWGAFLEGSVDDPGEVKGHCLWHADENPSADYNFEKGVWVCRVCGEGGGIENLKAQIAALIAAGVMPIYHADGQPCGKYKSRGSGSGTGEGEGKAEPLSAAAVAGWHAHLLSNADRLRVFMERRGLTLDTIEAYRIGFDSDKKCYTLPIYDEDEKLVNVRRYRFATANRKRQYWSLTGHGGRRLFPEAVLRGSSELVLCEGEWDALLLNQHGIATVTATGGAGNWREEFGVEFTGKKVHIAYDADTEGQKGRLIASSNISPHTKSVSFVDLPKGQDVTDFLVKGKRSAKEFRALLTGLAAPASKDPAWPLLDEAALHGLAGAVVRTLLPHSEAAPVALLAQYLVAFGNTVGLAPHFMVEGDRHSAREYMVLVGPTASGRKGLSWGRIRQVFDPVDLRWTNECVYSGLATGEGLVASFGENDDKRMLVIEEEFSRVLAQNERKENTLSMFIRVGWDSDVMRLMTKSEPLHVTGVHLSIIAHITPEEFKKRVSEVEVANGFVNRFLMVLAKRSKELPEGGDLDPSALARLQKETARALSVARKVKRMQRDEAAREQWAHIYRELIDEDASELYAAATARAQAHVLRLSMLYALLDGSEVIRVEHQSAAYALWRYCSASAAYLFGGSTGDLVADRLLRALEERGKLSHTKQSVEVFKRNQPARRLQEARDLLLRLGKTEEYEVQRTGGRNRRMTKLKA